MPLTLAFLAELPISPLTLNYCDIFSEIGSFTPSVNPLS